MTNDGQASGRRRRRRLKSTKEGNDDFYVVRPRRWQLAATRPLPISNDSTHISTSPIIISNNGLHAAFFPFCTEAIAFRAAVVGPRDGDGIRCERLRWQYNWLRILFIEIIFWDFFG